MTIKTENGPMDVASNGKANAGLTLGIIGTGLAALGGGLGNIFGGSGGGSCGPSGGGNGNYVSQESFLLAQSIAAKDSEIAILKAKGDVDAKLVDVYAIMNDKVNALRDDMSKRWEVQGAINTQQSVYNATNNAQIQCLTNQLAQIQAMTKLVIPIDNVCPTPALATTTASTT